MKTLRGLLLVSAATACLSSTAFAADLETQAASPWDAFVAASAGYAWFDEDDEVTIFGGEDPEDFTADVRASASYQFSGGFGVQSDLVFNYQAVGEDGVGADEVDVEATTFDAAGHAFYRPGESWLIGAFGQYGSSTNDRYSLEVDRFYGGGEAQVYFGNVTLYAQGGYQGYSGGFEDDLDSSGFFVSGEGRYFATPNLKLFAKATYNELDFDGGSFEDTDTSVWSVAGGVEYRLDDSPLSVFVNADYSEREFNKPGIGSDNQAEYGVARVMAGLKLNLFAGTLIDRDRSGATLDPFASSSDLGFLNMVAP